MQQNYGYQQQGQMMMMNPAGQMVQQPVQAQPGQPGQMVGQMMPQQPQQPHYQMQPQMRVGAQTPQQMPIQPGISFNLSCY